MKINGNELVDTCGHLVQASVRWPAHDARPEDKLEDGVRAAAGQMLRLQGCINQPTGRVDYESVVCLGA